MQGRSRRGVLAALGTGLSGLAGCQTGAEDSTTTTTARPTTSTWSVDPLDHDRVVGAYYYTWYRPAYAGEAPWTTWVPDDEPVLGAYDSRDPAVINQHVAWALEHGINWFNISWARAGSWDDGRFIQDYFLPTALGSAIDFSVFHEGVEFDRREDGAVSFDDAENRRKLRRDFQYFEQAYFGEPNYLTIDDRPVVSYYAAHEFTGAVDTAIQAARAAIDADPYLIACVLGANTTTGVRTEVATPWIDAVDAVTGYSLYDGAVTADYATYRDWATRELERWALVADSVDAAYVPTLLPGLNDTQIPDRPDRYKHPVLPRDPAAFEGLGRAAVERADPDLDAVLVTSFNEWPEYTAVEPSTDFGTTYLQAIRDGVAAHDPATRFDPAAFPMVQLRFDRTVPGPENPIQLALMCDRLSVAGDAATYDVGDPDREPMFVEGAFPAKHTPDDPHVPYATWRWFGGPTARTTLFLAPTLADATTMTIQGTAPPFAETSIGVDVLVDGTVTDHVTVAPDPGTYEVALTA